MIANDNMITNDNNSTIYNHKKRKMNEEIIDYKELYEKEQRDNRMLKNEIRMIHITCVNLIERHNLMQTSITVLKNGLEALSSEYEDFISDNDYEVDDNINNNDNDNNNVGSNNSNNNQIESDWTESEWSEDSFA